MGEMPAPATRATRAVIFVSASNTAHRISYEQVAKKCVFPFPTTLGVRTFKTSPTRQISKIKLHPSVIEGVDHQDCVIVTTCSDYIVRLLLATLTGLSPQHQSARKPSDPPMQSASPSREDPSPAPGPTAENLASLFFLFDQLWFRPDALKQAISSYAHQFHRYSRRMLVLACIRGDKEMGRMAIDAMGEDKGVTYEISRKAPEHLSPAWIWAYARARKDVNVEDAKLPATRDDDQYWTRVSMRFLYHLPATARTPNMAPPAIQNKDDNTLRLSAGAAEQTDTAAASIATSQRHVLVSLSDSPAISSSIPQRPPNRRWSTAPCGPRLASEVGSIKRHRTPSPDSIRHAHPVTKVRRSLRPEALRLMSSPAIFSARVNPIAKPIVHASPLSLDFDSPESALSPIYEAHDKTATVKNPPRHGYRSRGRSIGQRFDHISREIEATDSTVHITL